MIFMKQIVILLASIGAIVQGCCPKLYPHKTTNTEHTVVVTETIRDTVIRVQPDSSIVQALIKCDSTGRARLEEIRTLKESSRIQQSLALKDNKLTAKAVVDSLGIYLTYKERHKEEQQVRTIESVIEKEVNVLKWWQKTLMAIGSVAMILFASTIIVRFIGPSSNRL